MYVSEFQVLIEKEIDIPYYSAQNDFIFYVLDIIISPATWIIHCVYVLEFQVLIGKENVISYYLVQNDLFFMLLI